jgi:hypothetical protein
MGQGQRAGRIGITGKGDEPDEVVRPAGKVTLAALHKLEKNPFCHLEPVQLFTCKNHLSVHAAGAVNHNLYGYTLADVIYLFHALKRPCQSDDEQDEGHDPQHIRQVRQSAAQGNSCSSGVARGGEQEFPGSQAKSGAGKIAVYDDGQYKQRGI